MNIVAPSLLSGIVYASDAFFVWEDLQERFDKVNLVWIYQLHREIATVTQGIDIVSVYYTKLKELWAEYDTMVMFRSSECQKSKDYVDHLRQQRLMQFLGGLYESHSQSRRQILMKTIEPTLNQAYAMITEEESQKHDMDRNTVGIKNVIEGNDITAFWTVAKQLPSKPTIKNPNAFCDYCHSKGHMRADSFQLVGYPPWFKGKKRKDIMCSITILCLLKIHNYIVLSMVFIMQEIWLHLLMEIHLFLRIIMQVRYIHRLEELIIDLVSFLVIL